MIGDQLSTLIKEHTKNFVLLYVESDETIAKDTLKLLNKLFSNVIYASNGKDGISKFNENHIDLMVVDIDLPDISGLDMLEDIKLLAPETAAIIMTTHNEEVYYKQAIHLNIKDYLKKPVEESELKDSILMALEDIYKREIESNKFKYLLNANKKLLDIAYQISSQRDIDKMLENVLIGAKELSNADGGTLYILNEENKTLDFKISLNDTLNIHAGGTGTHDNWQALELYNYDDSPNTRNVAVVSALEEKLININNVYQTTSYNFSGARKFDATNNYRTTSMLVVPMKNREDKIIGVIQLINKIDDNHNITSFVSDDETLISAMASTATMVLENNQLVHDLEKFLYALITSIGSAINAKSKYTARHIDKVAILAELIAHGINENKTIYKDINFSVDELEEIRLSALLHDIGKISTPGHIMDKATKLEKVFDRIELIRTRFEVHKKDIEILYLKDEISEIEKNESIDSLNLDFKFVENVNDGQTYMSDDCIARLDRLFEEGLLTQNEHYNLSIRAGTLNNEDRHIINNHVVVTYDMIKNVPFPKKYSNAITIASSHHKTLDGGGYAAEELKGLELTIADKILVLADIFEALSTQDRPYKKANSINQIATILKSMVDDNLIDNDIVKMFFEDKLYLEYAKGNLDDSQLDELKIEF